MIRWMLTHFHQQVGAMRRRRRLHVVTTQYRSMAHSAPGETRAAESSPALPLGEHPQSSVPAVDQQARAAKPDQDQKSLERLEGAAAAVGGGDLLSMWCVEEGHRLAGLLLRVGAVAVLEQVAGLAEAWPEALGQALGGRRRERGKCFLLEDQAARVHLH